MDTGTAYGLKPGRHRADLTEVGAGTPMGELLRRYWYPIAFEQDFDTVPSKSVRLLSEDWTLYKTPSGKYGIIGEKCAHRSASLLVDLVAFGLRRHRWQIVLAHTARHAFGPVVFGIGTFAAHRATVVATGGDGHTRNFVCGRA